MGRSSCRFGIAAVAAVVSGVAHAQTTERVSVSTAGAQANLYSESVSISGDGRYVAFTSVASNLVPGDANGTYDVFAGARYYQVWYRNAAGFCAPATFNLTNGYAVVWTS